jgi:hypothetical protein
VLLLAALVLLQLLLVVLLLLLVVLLAQLLTSLQLVLLALPQRKALPPHQHRLMLHRSWSLMLQPWISSSASSHGLLPVGTCTTETGL